MKVPFNWLKDYVDVSGASAEEVAHQLTIAGLEVVMIEKINNDSVFDIEITPNRPDCLSILGVAREVSACLGKRIKTPKTKAIKKNMKEKPAIEIKDKKLCPRYTARIIRNVKVGPSPKWIADRLKTMGLRPVNNVADITNYCLFELGQPTHAFDRDKIKGGIIVRCARKNEKIVTIDGKERGLKPDMLVIADDEKAVAIAGVMGSKDAEVTSSTRNILFESAYFNPVSIRRTSRSLGLISESSYRFERSVNKGGIVSASNRACSLITELCGGETGIIADVGEKDPKDVKIYLRPERLKRILGLEISVYAIKKILSSLQLTVAVSGKDTLIISVPSFRQDLKTEEDLIEEVVRIYGYDKLPSTMPTIVGHPTRIERPRVVSNIVREALVSLGGNEVITYSLISKDDLSSVKDIDDDKLIVIKNPLSIEQEIMRPALIPGLLDVVSWNLNRKSSNFTIFELGKAYFKDANRFTEEECLAIACVGGASYKLVKEEPSFFDAKGILEALFKRLGISDILFKDRDFPYFLTKEAASVWAGNEKIGYLGRLKKETLDRFDIKTEVFICEISLKSLFSRAELEKRFKEIPKFPSAERDVSIIVKSGVTHEHIVSVIKETGGELVAKVELFDQYFGAQIPTESRGLSYSVEYRAKDRTLTDAEVGALHDKVCDALAQKLGARLR